MTGDVELRGFMGLAALFSTRRWPMPLRVHLATPISGRELLSRLDIPEEMVEIFFINGRVFLPDEAMIRPGDRVALAPPGTPGPYRVLLGFKNNEMQG